MLLGKYFLSFLAGGLVLSGPAFAVDKLSQGSAHRGLSKAIASAMVDVTPKMDLADVLIDHAPLRIVEASPKGERGAGMIPDPHAGRVAETIDDVKFLVKNSGSKKEVELVLQSYDPVESTFHPTPKGGLPPLYTTVKVDLTRPNAIEEAFKNLKTGQIHKVGLRFTELDRGKPSSLNIPSAKFQLAMIELRMHYIVKQVFGRLTRSGAINGLAAGIGAGVARGAIDDSSDVRVYDSKEILKESESLSYVKHKGDPSQPANTSISAQ